MTDSRSASLVLIAGAAGVAYWYWHLTHGALAPAQAAPGANPGPSGTGGLPTTSAVPGSDLGKLEAFAKAWGLTITSGYRPGANSLHGSGEAVDVAVPAPSIQAQVEAAAAALGIHIYPETKGQVGANGSVSTGAHWHLSIPQWRNGKLVF